MITHHHHTTMPTTPAINKAQEEREKLYSPILEVQTSRTAILVSCVLADTLHIECDVTSHVADRCKRHFCLYVTTNSMQMSCFLSSQKTRHFYFKIIYLFIYNTDVHIQGQIIFTWSVLHKISNRYSGFLSWFYEINETSSRVK